MKRGRSKRRYVPIYTKVHQFDNTLRAVVSSNIVHLRRSKVLSDTQQLDMDSDFSNSTSTRTCQGRELAFGQPVVVKEDIVGRKGGYWTDKASGLRQMERSFQRLGVTEDEEVQCVR